MNFTVGQKIGRLTVIELSGKKPQGSRNRRFVKARCDCGSIGEFRQDWLSEERVKSCGCYNREMVGNAARGRSRTKLKIGQKFNRLTVTGIFRKREHGNSVVYAECSCECGGTTRLRAGSLDVTLSCGCASTEHIKRVHLLNRREPGAAAAHACYLNNRNGAIKRKVPFDISEEDFKRISAMACHYCENPPTNRHIGRWHGAFVYNGLDRVDNNSGYSAENCVACCWTCNRFKGVKNQEGFRAWVQRVKSPHHDTSAISINPVISSRKPKNKRQHKPGDAAWNTVIGEYSYHAKQRKLSFLLGLDDLKNICAQHCFYCGDAPSRLTKYGYVEELKINGIDRIDNSAGYSVVNCRPCCGQCNRAKNSMSSDEFLNHISKIWMHQQTLLDPLPQPVT